MGVGIYPYSKIYLLVKLVEIFIGPSKFNEIMFKTHINFMCQHFHDL